MIQKDPTLRLRKANMYFFGPFEVDWLRESQAYFYGVTVGMYAPYSIKRDIGTL